MNNQLVTVTKFEKLYKNDSKINSPFLTLAVKLTILYLQSDSVIHIMWNQHFLDWFHEIIFSWLIFGLFLTFLFFACLSWFLDFFSLNFLTLGRFTLINQAHASVTTVGPFCTDYRIRAWNAHVWKQPRIVHSVEI